MTTEKCKCGCCHVPDYGACDTFEKGMNGLCVYCDHGLECHPGKGTFFNGPIGLGTRAKPTAREEIKKTTGIDLLKAEIPKPDTEIR